MNNTHLNKLILILFNRNGVAGEERERKNQSFFLGVHEYGAEKSKVGEY